MLTPTITLLSGGSLLLADGFRLLYTAHRRVMGVTAYVPGRQKPATEREHLLRPDALSREVVFAGMLPVYVRELEVDVYAEALLLERQEGRVIQMVPSSRRLAA